MALLVPIQRAGKTHDSLHHADDSTAECERPRHHRHRQRIRPLAVGNRHMCRHHRRADIRLHPRGTVPAGMDKDEVDGDDRSSLRGYVDALCLDAEPPFLYAPMGVVAGLWLVVHRLGGTRPATLSPLAQERILISGEHKPALAERSDTALLHNPLHLGGGLHISLHPHRHHIYCRRSWDGWWCATSSTDRSW